MGERYVKMHRRGEITVYPGTGDAGGGISDGGVPHAGAASGSSRWSRTDTASPKPQQAFAEAGIHLVEVEHERDAETVADEGWPVFWRPVGAGPDGAMDVRGFQGEVLESHLGMAPCLMMESAVAEIGDRLS